MGHREYLEKSLKNFKSDDYDSQVTHCILGMFDELGEIASNMKKVKGYKLPETEELKINFKEELGDALFFATIFSHLYGLESIVNHLDGIATHTDDGRTDMNVLTDMMEGVIEMSKSSRHNYYLDSIMNRFIRDIRVLSNRRGFSLFQVMESNIKKLQVRHGEGFKQEATEEGGRDRDEEAKALS